MRFSLDTSVIGLVCWLLLSCGGEGDEPLTPETAPKALTFTAVVDASASSRADTPSPLQSTFNSFLVWAKKTMPDNSAQTVINGYKVEYLTSKPATGGETWGDGSSQTDGLSYWSYDHIPGQTIKYWDESAQSYLFRAVAPATEFEDGDIEISLTNNHITLNHLPGNVPEKNATDFVVATTDRAGGNYTDVPLNFRHIYSKVEFRVYATSPLTLRDARIELGGATDSMPTEGSVTTTAVNFPTDKDLWTPTPGATSTLIAYESYLSSSGKQIPVESANAAQICLSLEIPHEFPSDGRTISVAFTDNTSGKTYNGSFTLTATNNGSNSWLQGKHYIYTLKINNDTSTNTEVILFAVDMDVWKWQMGSEEEETQTNW